MVGGLLVAVAAVGTWWAATGGGGDRAPRYVVAGRTVGPGEHLSADDLALTAVELPESLRRAAFTDPDEVVGSVSMGPLAPGELVQAGSIGEGAGTPGAATTPGIKQYLLMADSGVNLAPHLNHKVRVTGRVEIAEESLR